VTLRAVWWPKNTGAKQEAVCGVVGPGQSHVVVGCSDARKWSPVDLGCSGGSGFVGGFGVDMPGSDLHIEATELSVAYD
jgi:hypothetical protein